LLALAVQIVWAGLGAKNRCFLCFWGWDIIFENGFEIGWGFV